MKTTLSLILFALLTTICQASSLSGGGSSFTPYGPGNPAPASSIPVTGILYYSNADILTQTAGTTITSFPDMSGTLTATGAGTTSPILVNNYGFHNALEFTGVSGEGLTIGSGLSVTVGAMSWYTIMQTSTRQQSFFMTFGPTYSSAYESPYILNQGAFLGIQGNTGTVNSNLVTGSGIQLYGCSLSPTDTYFYMNDRYQDVVHANPASVYSGAFLGGLIGNSGFEIYGDMYATIVFNHNLSNSEYSAFQKWVNTNYQINDYKGNINIICEGDSITGGTNLNGGKTWENVLADSLPFGCNIFNIGIGGLTQTQMISNQSTLVNPLLNPTAENIVIAWGGTNDIVVSGSTAANAAVTNYQMCANSRGKGAYVIDVDALPRASSSTITSFNSAILNTSTGATAIGAADYCWDANNDTKITLGSDSIHPNLAGCAEIGRQLSYIISGLIGGRSLPASKGGSVTLSSGSASVTTYLPWGMVNPAIVVSGGVTTNSYKGAAAAGTSIVTISSSSGSDSSVVNYLIYDNH